MSLRIRGLAITVVSISLLAASPASPAAAAGPPSFVVPTQTTAGVLATAPIVADVNGDGRPDVLAGDRVRPGVSALLGNGQGGLGSPIVSALPAGATSSDLATADFNGDRVLDLAVATSTAQGTGLTILRGRGDGSFVLLTTLAVKAIEVIAADLDGDGDADLAAVTKAVTGGGISVALGNGSGAFTAPVTYVPPFQITHNDLASSDVDADGDLDLVYMSGCPVVRLNAGNGSFGPEICNPDPQGRWGGYLDVGDLDRDGVPDLATVGDGIVTVGKGTGAGRFTILNQYSGLAADFQWLDIADVTGDNKPDIVAGSDDIVVVLKGRGDGSFLGFDRWVSGGADIIAEDMNGDGRRDLVSAGGLRSDDVAITVNKGAGAFGAPRDFVSYGESAVGSIIESGDLNADGRPDVVIALSGSPVAHLNRGGGVFGPPLFSSGFSVIQSMALADINRDGKLDVVAGVYQPGDTKNIFVMLGRGNGRFKPAQTYSNGSTAATLGVAVADVNADGFPDIVSNTFTSLSVLPGRANGTFGPPKLSGVGAGDQRATLLGDLTGDGRIDAVSAVVTGTHDNARTTLYVNVGKGDGTFTLGSSQTTDTNVRAAALGQLTGDGRLDVALVGIKGTHTGRTGLFLFPNLSGALAAPSYQPAGWNDLSLADLNRDGFLDAVSVCPELAGGCLRVNANQAGAGFAAPIELPTAHDPVSVTTADFTGDQRPDIAELLADRAPSTFAVFVNATP